MKFLLDNVLNFRIDPFKKKIHVEFMGMKGECNVQQVLPLNGNTDAAKMKSLMVNGISEALGITPRDVKLFLQDLETELTSYIDLIDTLIQ